MSRKQHSVSKQLVVATVLALSASGVALANDSSTNPFTGDSYAYFNGGQNLGNFNVARASQVQAPNTTAAGLKKGDQAVKQQVIFSNGKLTIAPPRLFNDNTAA